MDISKFRSLNKIGDNPDISKLEEENISIFSKSKQANSKQTDSVSNKNFTHSSLGHPWSTFSISDNDVDKYLDNHWILLNCETGEDWQYITHISENAKDVSILCVDLDFIQISSKRLYTKQIIQNTILCVFFVFSKYFTSETLRNNLLCFVTEKNNPDLKKNKNGKKEYKDGLHLFFPKLFMPSHIRKFILKEIATYAAEQKIFDDLISNNMLITTKYHEIVDQNYEKIMVYGCVKAQNDLFSQSYELSSIYESIAENLNETHLPKYLELYSDTKLGDILDNYNVAKYLSLRKYKNKDPIVRLVDSHKSDVEGTIDIFERSESDVMKRINENIKNKVKNKTVERQQTNLLPEIRQLRKTPPSIKEIEIQNLVALFNEERSSIYSSWIATALSLKTLGLVNGENTDNYFIIFDNFSRLSTKKYDGINNRKIWDGIKQTNLYNKEYLAYAVINKWARNDNPKLYAKIIEKKWSKLIFTIQPSDDTSIAVLLKEKFADNFVYCPLKSTKIWYVFNGIRWTREFDSACIHNVIDDKYIGFFTKVFKTLQYSGDDDEDCSIVEKKKKSIKKIMERLRTLRGKNTITSTLNTKIIDSDFENKLDCNSELLGFANGVYDLSTLKFRNARYDDFISMSTGYDYPSDPELIKQGTIFWDMFFSNIHIEKDVRDYRLILAACHLKGGNERQRFYISIANSGCHAIGTKILLFNGTYKNVELISQNDVLMGDDYTKRNIKALARGKGDLYEIESDDKFKYIVNDEHILSLLVVGNYFICESIIQWFSYINGKLHIIESNEKSIEYHMNLYPRIKENSIINMKVTEYLSWKNNISFDINNFIKEYRRPLNNITETHSINIKYYSFGSYFGFDLDKNKLYQIGRNIVTHNSNGKSKYAKAMELALGDYYGSVSPTLITKERAKSNEASPEIKVIMKKRYIVMSETESTDTINVGMMKQITGGDSIMARQMYDSEYSTKIRCAFELFANVPPKLNSIDGGVMRRLEITKWGTEFVNYVRDDSGKIIGYEKNGDPVSGKKFYREKLPNIEREMEKYKSVLMYMLINTYYPLYIKQITTGKKDLILPQKIIVQNKKYFKENDAIYTYITTVWHKVDNPTSDDYTYAYKMFEVITLNWKFNNQKPKTFDIFLSYLKSNENIYNLELNKDIKQIKLIGWKLDKR